MHPTFRRVGELLLTVLQVVIPKTDVVSIYGSPITEGNAVETVSALSRRYQGRIIWLVDSEPEKWRLAGSLTPVSIVRKRTVRGLYSYMRSEIVFFTHEVYGAVHPSRRQTFVNLWHGDGIKRKPTTEVSRHSLLPATYVSGGTHVLSARKAHDFKMPAGSQLVFGNPRILQFRDPVPASFLEAIGLSNLPYVIWMPTFRKSSVTGIGYEANDVAELMVQLVEVAHKFGVRVIVKAHQQDAESRGIAGAISVSDSELAEHAVSLYSLIGGSVALITDYSSVWTDYLLLNRPIGFLIPDADTYSRTRGVYPEDVLDWLPGPRIETRSDIEGFIRTVTGDSNENDNRRVHAKAKLGLVDFEHPADRILDELHSRGCFRKGLLTNDTPDVGTRPKLVRIVE